MELAIYTPASISTALPTGLSFRMMETQKGQAALVAVITMEDGSHTLTTVSDPDLVRFILPTLLKSAGGGTVPQAAPPVAPMAAAAIVETPAPNPSDKLSDYARRIDVAERAGDIKEMRRLQLEMIELVEQQTPSQREIDLINIPELDTLEKTMTVRN